MQAKWGGINAQKIRPLFYIEKLNRMPLFVEVHYNNTSLVVSPSRSTLRQMVQSKPFKRVHVHKNIVHDAHAKGAPADVIRFFFSKFKVP